MHELKVSATFAAILVAAAAIGVTMGALLMQFQAPGDPATAWRSLIISLAGVGVALCLICLLHLSLATGGLVVRSAQARRVEAWLGRWARVAGGEDPPTVEPSERTAASEAGAQILQDVSGQGAQRIRDAMAAAGLIERDVSLAA